MIIEGTRIDYLRNEISQLEKKYEDISNSPHFSSKSHYILSQLAKKIEKYKKELSNWYKLHAAVDESVDVPPATLQHQSFSSDFINFIKRLENDAKVGFDGKIWRLHKSPEGGLPEIAYGHKIQNKKELLQYKNGISNTDAEKLLVRDLELARQKVHSYIYSKYKVKLTLPLNKEEMLTEFAFNLGSLSEFPKLVDAVLRDNWDVVKKEYKRTATIRGVRGELTTRNKEFYDRYLKNIPTKPLKELDRLQENMKRLIVEGIREKALEDYLRNIVKGTEWEGKVYIAGGYVRDEFMGKDPKDLDLMVNAPNGGFEFAKWITKKTGTYRGPAVDPPIPPKPDWNIDKKGKPATEADKAIEDAWMTKLEAIQKLYSNPVIFPRFGTAKFNLRGIIHQGVDFSEMDIEAVMPRKEQYAAGSRKPTVSAGTLEDDVERRDFTVNSLLKDLSTGEILDLTGRGKADIKAGIVVTPLDPDKIFTDDPLRMLRAVRFTMKYNWHMPMFMLRGLKKNASQLQNISEERIRDELNKILLTGSPDRAIKLLKVVGLLPYVIPELQTAVGMTQNIHHKHDVFTHSLQVLKNTEPEIIERLAGILHDIGKIVTRSVTPTGVHFYGHEGAGAKIAEQVMFRLKYPDEMIKAVSLIIRKHMSLKHGGDTAIKLSDKTLRKFKMELGDNLAKALHVIHADNIAHADASAMPNQIDIVKKRLDNLKMNISTTGGGLGKPQLPITGQDLITLGIKKGPIYSVIMKEVTEAWFENPNLTKDEAIEIAKKVARV